MRKFRSAYRFYRRDHGNMLSRRTLPRWRAMLGAWRFSRHASVVSPAALKAFRVSDRIYAELNHLP